jgi:hypothetical protein
VTAFSCNNDKNSINNEESASQLALIKIEELDKDENGIPIKRNYYEGPDHLIEVTVIENISLRGELAVLGDATFNELVFITTDNEKYTIRSEYREQYWTRQGESLLIKGKAEKRVITEKATGKITIKNWLYPMSAEKI